MSGTGDANQANFSKLPVHVGIIMDGNGRWAAQKGKPRAFGHEQGARTFEKITRYCRDIGIQYLTVYAFSTENWSRPADEVERIMDLLQYYLSRLCKDVKSLQKERIRLLFLGERGALPKVLRESMDKAEQLSAQNDGITVCIALNYGGRAEITDAVRRIVRQAQSGFLAPEDVDERLISGFLYQPGVPDPDLIIRPSGEKRTSNFLLWQSAYSEYVFQDVLWPDFDRTHLDAALHEYAARSRRFGGVEGKDTGGV